MRAAGLTFAAVLLAGALGFRLDPDSGTYAAGRLLPNSLAAGLAGRLGGMALLVLVSAIAAAAVVHLLPGSRARLLFVALGGFWLLFPGADALGVLGVALLARARSRSLVWTLTAGLHLVAALVTLPMLRRWRFPWAWASVLAVGVGAVFTLLDPSGPVAPWEHAVYTSRYLLPAAWLFANSHGLVRRLGVSSLPANPPAHELVLPKADAGLRRLRPGVTVPWQ